jgi:hypothetical protein
MHLCSTCNFILQKMCIHNEYNLIIDQLNQHIYIDVTATDELVSLGIMNWFCNWWTAAEVCFFCFYFSLLDRWTVFKLNSIAELMPVALMKIPSPLSQHVSSVIAVFLSLLLISYIVEKKLSSNYQDATYVDHHSCVVYCFEKINFLYRRKLWSLYSPI